MDAGSEHFDSSEGSLADVVDGARAWWGARPPAYGWVLGRPSSHRARLPPPGDDAWWDALAAARGAVELLSDKRCWVGRHKHHLLPRAAVGYAKWGKRRGDWKRCASTHQCDAANERAVRWTALGALERASGAPDGPGVVLALEVARRAAGGRPLALVEEVEGYRGIMRVLRRTAERAEKAAEGRACRRRRSRRGGRSETRVSEPATSGVRSAGRPATSRSLPCARAG